MRTKILFTAITLSLTLSSFGKIWTITNFGTTFNPTLITISFGDTVQFSIENAHEVREVSIDTWTANQTTAIEGGFSTAFGGGLILPAQLGVGTHYYVCVPHAGSGMKGRIIVEGPAGLLEGQKNIGFSIFPNPADHQITIKTTGNLPRTTYTIVDNMGRQLLSGKVNSEVTTLDIEILSNGVYSLIISNSRKHCYKIIKE